MRGLTSEGKARWFTAALRTSLRLIVVGYTRCVEAGRVQEPYAHRTCAQVSQNNMRHRWKRLGVLRVRTVTEQYEHEHTQ